MRHDEESLGAQAQLVPAETDLGVACIGQAVGLVHRLRSFAANKVRKTKKKKHPQTKLNIPRRAMARAWKTRLSGKPICFTRRLEQIDAPRSPTQRSTDLGGQVYP